MLSRTHPTSNDYGLSAYELRITGVNEHLKVCFAEIKQYRRQAEASMRAEIARSENEAALDEFIFLVMMGHH